MGVVRAQDGFASTASRARLALPSGVSIRTHPGTRLMDRVMITLHVGATRGDRERLRAGSATLSTDCVRGERWKVRNIQFSASNMASALITTF